jgi:hypothetical protein
MIVYILCIFLFLITNAYLTFDEELLVVIAAFLWTDAAGSFFRRVASEELVYKVDTLRLKFVSMLFLRRSLLRDLLELHIFRQNLALWITATNAIFLNALLNGLLVSFVSSRALRRSFRIQLLVISVGNEIFHDRFINSFDYDSSLSFYSGDELYLSTLDKGLGVGPLYTSFSRLVV